MPAPTRPGRTQLIGLALLVVLLVAMVLNTRFITPKELASIGPQKFDPVATAKKLYKRAGTSYADQAAALPEVVRAIQTDPKKAASTYDAAAPNSTTLVFAVKGTGTVVAANAASLQLKVDGVPGQTQVLVPTSTAINGTVLRDALGFKFADAPGQSDYQRVGDELKKLMTQAVSDSVGDPASQKGKRVTVTGVISVANTGGAQPPAKPVSIQPVSVEAGS